MPASLLLAALLGATPAPVPSAAIRLNQVGMTPSARKVAILPSSSPTPLSWVVRDDSGKVRASGKTIPFGIDRWSGESVHRIDFSALQSAGRFTINASGTSSRPFVISSDANQRLPTDALAFFYHQRAGTPIEASVVGTQWARPAAHRPEVATCVKGKDPHGNVWPGCDWTLDVTGGWYDAGDHGKYVVNGGISLWTLLNLYERQPSAFPDGSAMLAERGNDIPDLLDEARYELDFFLRMQVPDSKRIRVPVAIKRAAPGMAMTEIDASGMVHHKVADENWTGIPMRPDQDPEKRQLFAPTTAATLNFAAVTAQCARLWRTLDPSFSARCLAASRRAFAAAQRNPQVYAVADFTGSGGYGDDQLEDEFFWAAAELATTTGERTFRDLVERSQYARAPISGEPGWGSTAVLGLLTLAGHERDGGRAGQAIVAAADRFLAERNEVGYGVPYAPRTGYPWGSTSSILNRAMLLAVAHDLTGKRQYLDGVTDSMDFLLGRNPLDQSFVTGFGARPIQNPHHRFWANLPDQGFPGPPPGVISGGPNSQNSPRSDEPVGPPKDCAPQTCWVDDHRSFTTNEVAINWNAPLVWVSSWLKANGR